MHSKMKTTKDYLDACLDKYNYLKKKNELWRIRVTPQQFLSEIEKGKNARKEKYWNEYHIQRNEEASVSILLMDILTPEEMKDQCRRLKLQRAQHPI